MLGMLTGLASFQLAFKLNFLFDGVVDGQSAQMPVELDLFDLGESVFAIDGHVRKPLLVVKTSGYH